MPMNPTEVSNYIEQLPNGDSFTSLDPELQTKVMFGAYQQLKRTFGEPIVTDEMTALQILFFLEGDDEFAVYRRQGIKTVTTRDVSFTFDTTLGSISPDVIAMVELIKGGSGDEGPALFGRLT